jgi:hypothetical protein
LGVEPLTGTDQFALAWGVIAFGPVGDDTAPSAHGHPSVGLGTVMLVEAAAHLLLFR